MTLVDELIQLPRPPPHDSLLASASLSPRLCVHSPPRPVLSIGTSYKMYIPTLSELQHVLLSAALSMESGSSRRDVEILMC